MVDVDKTVNSFSKNIISLLHYVFPPIVGLLIVYVGYECDIKNINKYLPKTALQGVVVLFVIIALGLTIYHIHRALVHHIPLLIIRFFAKNMFEKNSRPKNFETNFARWIRRGSDKDGHAVQKALDLANAGGHFLYCSCWSAIIWLIILKNALSAGSLVSPCLFWFMTGGLLFAAISGEIWTTWYDHKAYMAYNLNATHEVPPAVNEASNAMEEG
jgi:hypothetical protein